MCHTDQCAIFSYYSLMIMINNTTWRGHAITSDKLIPTLSELPQNNIGRGNNFFEWFFIGSVYRNLSA